MPNGSPSRSATRKNVTPALKKEIMNSLNRFNRTVRARFNAGNPPSKKAMYAALKALATRGGGRTRRRRH